MTSVAEPTTNLVQIESSVLGTVAVPAASVFDFADGIHGFNGHRKFALVSGGRDGLFWLQSTRDSNLTFLLVDPFAVQGGYEVDLGPTEKRALDVTSPDDVLLLAIVTLPASKKETPTANLRGPVVLNVRTARGCQSVTSDDRHSMHTPVDLLALPARAAV